MGSVTRFSGRAKKFTLFLLVFTLVCHILLLLLTSRSRSSSLFGQGDDQINKARLASLYFQSNDGGQAAAQSANASTNTPATTLLKITPWNITGSNELSYPLNIDIPEVVRCVMDNIPIEDVQPINKPEFPFLVTNPNRCQKRARTDLGPPDLLILVKSAPDHFLQRDAIRLTWGSEYCWGGRSVVRLFLLGDPRNYGNKTSQRLAKEIALYGDIIQQDFIDHYYNNTYKLLFGIEWAVQFCPDVPLIMFVDDDFFVYPLNAVRFIEGLSTALRQRLVAGYVWHNAAPMRNNTKGSSKKWVVSWDEFPNHQYPPYVAAGNFFISMPIARELRIAAWYTKYLRFDDVFLGILMKKLLRTPLHLSQVYSFVPVDESSDKQLSTMLSSHHYKNPASLFALWDRLNCNTFCVTPR